MRDIVTHEACKEEHEENGLSNQWLQVDMSPLKYRELDKLEGIFSLWMARGREAMDIEKSFQVRVRTLMHGRQESKVSKVISITQLLAELLTIPNKRPLYLMNWSAI